MYLKQERMIFSNEDKIIIQNNYKEKSWSAYKIWKSHPSKKSDFSSVKCLTKKFRETCSMDRRHGSGQPRTVSMEENMDFIGELVYSQAERPHTHSAAGNIGKQTGISQSLIQRMMKKET